MDQLSGGGSIGADVKHYMGDPRITAYFTVDPEAKPQTQARVPVTGNGNNEALNTLLYISF